MAKIVNNTRFTEKETEGEKRTLELLKKIT